MKQKACKSTPELEKVKYSKCCLNACSYCYLVSKSIQLSFEQRKLCYSSIKFTSSESLLTLLLSLARQSHHETATSGTVYVVMYTLLIFLLEQFRHIKNNEAQIMPKVKNNVRTIQAGIWNHKYKVYFFQ